MPPPSPHRFATLSPDPISFNSAFLVVVSAYPGGTTGKCLQSVTLGLVGLSLGLLVYAILGFLGRHTSCSHDLRLLQTLG